MTPPRRRIGKSGTSCGRPILLACPQCRTTLQNGARFCHACGTEAAGR